LTVPTNQVNVLLARRPAKPGIKAFGHVDVSAAGRTGLDRIVSNLHGAVNALNEVTFHPDDEAAADEVLTANLKGFDSWFQEKAAWSLERTVTEIRRTGLPETLGQPEIRDGGWSFYAIHVVKPRADVVAVRAKSPSWGLSSEGKLLTAFVGTQLKPVTEPLIAFDHSADILVVGQKVFVLSPRSAERLLVDAEAVKARAPETAASFNAQLGATLSPQTVSAIQRVCSHNANIARRVERLIRDEALSRVTAAEVRSALPDAGLAKTDFGKSGPLQAVTDGYATVLIDIAADLYYQPRFGLSPRRVASYREI
jgi:hypothetical protein